MLKKTMTRFVVSIFVNPKQFGPNEDFDGNYPRMIREDADKLKGLDVDAIFLPNAADMYPAGFPDLSNKHCNE